MTKILNTYLGGTEIIKREDHSVRYRFNRHEVSASELIVELARQHRIKDISVEEPEIEAIVREIYKRSSSGESIGKIE